MPSQPSQRVLLALAAAFVVLVALGIHGFSLPFWHVVPPSELRK